LLGDGKAIARQLNQALDNRQWFYPADAEWRTTLRAKAQDNLEAVAPMMDDDATPMNYYRAYRDIDDWLPDDAIVIGEGANTMDIGRTQMQNRAARHRLDAGSYGTMGIGLGFAVAAAVTNRGTPVVSVQGDSAFGFSGMEIETMVRYKLPVKLIVINNGGIGGGIGEIEDLTSLVQPSRAELRAAWDIIRADPGLRWLFDDPEIIPSGGFYDRSRVRDDPCSRDVCLLIEFVRHRPGHGFVKQVVVKIVKNSPPPPPHRLTSPIPATSGFDGVARGKQDVADNTVEKRLKTTSETCVRLKSSRRSDLEAQTRCL
jgi:hypothetical protein